MLSKNSCSHWWCLCSLVFFSRWFQYWEQIVEIHLLPILLDSLHYGREDLHGLPVGSPDLLLLDVELLICPAVLDMRGVTKTLILIFRKNVLRLSPSLPVFSPGQGEKCQTAYWDSLHKFFLLSWDFLLELVLIVIKKLCNLGPFPITNNAWQLSQLCQLSWHAGFLFQPYLWRTSGAWGPGAWWEAPILYWNVSHPPHHESILLLRDQSASGHGVLLPFLLLSLLPTPYSTFIGW